MTTADYPPPALRYPRSDFDAADLAALETAFDELEGRALGDRSALEAWLSDAMDLMAQVSAEGTRRNLAYSRNTADERAKERFDFFIAKVGPLFETRWDKLERRLVACPCVGELDGLDVFLRNTRENLEIFREENTELSAKDTQVYAEYAKLCGALTIEHGGETLTLQQARPLLESQDRALREGVWRKIAAARAAIRAECSGIFDGQLELRAQMAKNAGEPTYRELRFRQYHRFDYGVAECEAFHDAVARHMVPLASRIHADRRRRLGLDSLRPWDLDVDPDGADPFAPYDDEKELVALALELFAAVDPAFANDFRFLAANDCLDLWSRKDKAPGGFQTTLEDRRIPFIFANSAGSPNDIRTVLHEGGHAFHSLLARDYMLLPYRHSPIEFAEVASMSMELMTNEHLETVFPADEAARAFRRQLEHCVLLFPWVATIDAFQHWLYTHPGHDHETRRTMWVEISTRFAPDIDWSGIEEHRDHAWQRQLHLFKVPFYYIEYAIAQIGALQVWRNYRDDAARAVELYRDGLALGGSLPLPALFDAAGARFDFGDEMLGSLASFLEGEVFANGDSV